MSPGSRPLAAVYAASCCWLPGQPWAFATSETRSPPAEAPSVS